MEPPTGVHPLTQTVERETETLIVHPAAVETPPGLVLVDVGIAGEFDQIESELADAGLSMDAVRAVVLTHHDRDHAGALRTAVDRTGATVYAHERCAPHVDGREDTVKSPDGERYPPADVDVELVDGVRFRTEAGPMDVVFTPGHAPGHVSLHFPDSGFVLAGDALDGRDGTLTLPKPAFTPDVERAAESARRLADLRVDGVLCYHGGPIDADSDDVRAGAEKAA
jgi:glyoxylase-like metal-dependent hydrolase (beta-lactamase superfamily II)